MTRPCEWLNKRRLYLCPALAVHGSPYCAAHRAISQRMRPPPKPNRKEYQDADLLPLTKEEFTALAELRERSK